MPNEVKIEMGDTVKDKDSDFGGVICGTITTTTSRQVQELVYHPDDLEKKLPIARPKTTQVVEFKFNVFSEEQAEVKVFSDTQLELVKKKEVNP